MHLQLQKCIYIYTSPPSTESFDFLIAVVVRSGVLTLKFSSNVFVVLEMPPPESAARGACPLAPLPPSHTSEIRASRWILRQTADLDHIRIFVRNNMRYCICYCIC